MKNHRQATSHSLTVLTPPDLFFFPSPLSQVCAPPFFPDMEELLKHLTEVSIRQQQIVEHLATRQGQTEQELAARHAAAPRVPLPDTRAQATKLLPKMTPHDVERAPKKRHHQCLVLLASDSGRDGESPSLNTNLFFDVFQQVTGGGSFGREQREDDRLKHCWAQVRILDGKEVQPGPHPLLHFVVQKGLLYCVAQRRGEEKLLLVVPRTKTETVLELAHSHPMAGHLGPANTIQRIRDRFHWPGMDAEVKRFCQACPTCQVKSPKKPPPSPLIPLPIIEVPFERIGMDLVGPLPKSARGHEHILVIVDYATRYPEAIPLRKVTAKAIAQELFLLSSRVSIPAEILTDQGTPFMSRLMADLCRLLKVKQLRTTVYHPQADGLVERFNQTLKQMLRRVATEDKRDWDVMISYVLFGIREVPQASTGFTPFELLFGRQPRGLLDVAKGAWEQQPAAQRSVIRHVREMRGRIDRVMPLIWEHLSTAQQAQQRHYNRAAQPREFQPSDRVMVLVPPAACKFLATWQGPYTVLEKVGPVTYRIRQPGRRRTEQLYHVNLLKKWVGTRDQLVALACTEPVVVDTNPHLSAAQKGELQHLIGQFSDVFSPLPGQTNVIQHDIQTTCDPFQKAQNQKLLFPPLVATGSTGPFPSASMGHPPRSSI